VWQEHIQAVDLPSHLYNAWLANYLRAHPVPGLALVPQTTNILFDFILQALLRIFSLNITERIAVGLAVLVFFWSSFAFVTVVNAKRCWAVMPCLAMLAFGWVFQMGFFNYYLSLGLCLAAIALSWRLTPPRMIAALALLVIAYSAHNMPVLWAAAVVAYVHVTRRLSGWARTTLPMISGVCVGAVILLVGRIFECGWSSEQISGALGLDQLWLYRPQYFFLSLAFVSIWGLAAAKALDVKRSALPLDLIAFTALAGVILPTWVKLKAYSVPLTYIGPRTTLMTALLVSATLAPFVTRRLAICSALICGVFFSLLYADSQRLNEIESGISAALATIPQGSRVINGLYSSAGRLPLLLHNIDRACIGHCFSYASYEPASRAFLVNAYGDNPLVLHDSRTVDEVQLGSFVVKTADLPLWQLTLCSDSTHICTKRLQAGDVARQPFIEWRRLFTIARSSAASLRSIKGH
jgi:hypothetical protein